MNDPVNAVAATAAPAPAPPKRGDDPPPDAFETALGRHGAGQHVADGGRAVGGHQRVPLTEGEDETADGAAVRNSAA